PPGRVPDQTRTGPQPQDRQGARPRNPRQAARARRRGDRVRRREFITLIGGAATNVAIYLSSSYLVQSSSRILSARGWYWLTVVRGPMTIARHPCTGSGITFIAAALMPILVATISASSDTVFFSTASSKFFILSQSSGRQIKVKEKLCA